MSAPSKRAVMSPMAREFHDWVVDNGHGVYEGLNGRGHHSFRLNNGAYCACSATPSARSALLHAKAQVRQKLGISSDSPKAGKYSNKRFTGGYNGKNPAKHGEWDWPEEVQNRQERIGEVDEEIMASHPRRDQDKLRRLAAERVELADALKEAGVLPPPIRVAL